MEDANIFIEKYRPTLLSYLDGETKSIPQFSGPLEFIDEVLENWLVFSEGRLLDEPSQAERTFWFALYQLEEIVEYPASDQMDPYEGVLMKRLSEAREVLRDGGELPDGLYATRPGE